MIKFCASLSNPIRIYSIRHRRFDVQNEFPFACDAAESTGKKFSSGTTKCFMLLGLTTNSMQGQNLKSQNQNEKLLANIDRRKIV